MLPPHGTYVLAEKRSLWLCVLAIMHILLPVLAKGCLVQVAGTNTQHPPHAPTASLRVRTLNVSCLCTQERLAQEAGTNAELSAALQQATAERDALAAQVAALEGPQGLSAQLASAQEGLQQVGV